MQSFYQLPPHPNLCQKCAVRHDPDQPHNPQSFFYATWFYRLNGRSHTWNDAMAHCSNEVKIIWLEYLSNLNIDPNSTDINGEVTSDKQVTLAIESIIKNKLN